MTGGPPHRTFFTQLNSFADLSVAAIAFLWETLELGMGGTEWHREDSLKKKRLISREEQYLTYKMRRKMFSNQVEEVTIKRETRVMYFFL